MNKVDNSTVSTSPLSKFSLWEKLKTKRTPLSFDLEITARCNNNCRHCYINLPAGDKKAKKKELSLSEIKSMTDKAVSLGVLWCLITGGEPLLRDDFFDIYLYLKKKGLLISVFTNATLIREEHIKFFKKYPPREVEVSVYGVTQQTYEKVTRNVKSFAAFKQGLDLLLKNNIKVTLKAMALRSNIHEIPEISRFCRERSSRSFRFDPFLHLRYDGNSRRNQEIKSERLTPEEIINLEQSDPQRFESLKKNCDQLIITERSYKDCNHLFHCGVGKKNFVLGWDGFFRLCQSLLHPDCVYDLRKGSLIDAWNMFVPRVRDKHSTKKQFLERCHICPIINLCTWCPAISHLETGELDGPLDYFCRVAHEREKAVQVDK